MTKCKRISKTSAMLVLGLALCIASCAANKPQYPQSVSQGIVSARLLVAASYSTTADLLRAGKMDAAQATDVKLKLDVADALLKQADSLAAAGKLTDAVAALAAANTLLGEIRSGLETTGGLK